MPVWSTSDFCEFELNWWDDFEFDLIWQKTLLKNLWGGRTFSLKLAVWEHRWLLGPKCKRSIVLELRWSWHRHREVWPKAHYLVQGLLENMTTETRRAVKSSYLWFYWLELCWAHKGQRGTPSVFNTICENIYVTSSAPWGWDLSIVWKNITDWPGKSLAVFKERAHISCFSRMSKLWRHWEQKRCEMRASAREKQGNWLLEQVLEIWTSAASMWIVFLTK